MKELTEKQRKFLRLIDLSKGKCIREIGRMVYQTDVSCYNIRNLFIKKSLIRFEKIKGKEIPIITHKGKDLLKNTAQ